MKLLLAALSFLVLLTPSAQAKFASWDRENNIKEAAVMLVISQDMNGANGARVEVNQCYQQFVIFEEAFTKKMEYCLAQDIMLAQITAAIYSQVSEKALEMTGSPPPAAILNAMDGRVSDTFERLDLSNRRKKELFRLVEEVGMPAFLEFKQTGHMDFNQEKIDLLNRQGTTAARCC